MAKQSPGNAKELGVLDKRIDSTRAKLHNEMELARKAAVEQEPGTSSEQHLSLTKEIEKTAKNTRKQRRKRRRVSHANQREKQGSGAQRQ